VSDLLAYWRYDNYLKDLAEGASVNFNSKQIRLHAAITEGDSLWLITARREAGRVGKAYYVVARLVVRSKTINAPDYKYGKHRIWGDLSSSKYYQVGNREISSLLRRLRFSSDTPIGGTDKELALYFQTMRELQRSDTLLLEAWCEPLPLEQAAYQILPEELLEDAVEQGEESVRKIIQEYRPGLSEYRIEQLVQQPTRSRALSQQIHQLYNGRCQVCGFDPILVYGVEACHSHHLIYLSRGGEDTLNNMTLLCPNHHSVIHAANAVFDFNDLSFIFAPNHRERLALNKHLQANA
jgi:5-methylcytosine-specific restriction enzyme A